MSPATEQRRSHGWIGWLAVLLLLAAAGGYGWWRGARIAAERDGLAVELERSRQRAAACAAAREELRQRRDALAGERDRLAESLAAERAVPRGSLGELYFDYERFARRLRFEVALRIEYRVQWRLQVDADEHDPVTKAVPAAGTISRLQGVWLGRRSNFAFGLVALPDDAAALRLPAADAAFDPPSPEVVEQRRWLWDEEAEYALADPPVRRLLHAEVLAVGAAALEPPAVARVVRAWREPDKGYTVLLLGLAGAADGIDPGPPYVGERAWLATGAGLRVYPMTAPNGGLVLHKEDIGQAYRTDRRRAPADNSAYDYFRAGWLRSDWDGIAGRIEVLFAPLPPGDQSRRRPRVHSLIFPLPDRRAYWLPFWALRERLLAPAELQLAAIPAYNVERPSFALRLEGLPLRSAGQWDREAYRSALYALLKHKPVADQAEKPE